MMKESFSESSIEEEEDMEETGNVEICINNANGDVQISSADSVNVNKPNFFVVNIHQPVIKPNISMLSLSSSHFRRTPVRL